VPRFVGLCSGGHDVLRAFSIRVLARLVGAVLQAALLVLVARDLGPRNFGDVAQVLSLGTLAAAVLGFGMNSRALRLAIGTTPREDASAILSVAMVSSVAVTLVALPVAWMAGAPWELTPWAAAAFVASESFAEVVVAILAGLHRQHLASLMVVVRRAAALGIVVACAGLGVNLVYGLLLAAVSTAAISILIAPLFWSKPSSVSTLLRGSWGYWATSLVTNLQYLDTTLLRLSAGAHLVGLYGVSSRSVAPLSLATSSMVGVLVPELSRARSPQAHERLRRSIRRMSLVVAGTAIVASPLIATAVVTVLGSGYEGAFILVVAFCVGTGVSAISQTYQAEAFARGEPMRAVLAVGLGTAIGLVGLIGFSLFWGSVGAAAAIVLMQVAILAMFVCLDIWRRRQSVEC
jgi:O-antigen/teichoic acid export membrane protein